MLPKGGFVMKTATLRVVSLVLILSFAFALTGCGDLLATVDYPSVDSLSQALEVNADPTGKTVKVTAEKVISDGTSGFIIQQGKFNFCVASDPSMVPGNTAVFKISSISRQGDGYYVNCSKA